MHDFSPSNKLKTSILILQKSVLFVFTLGSPTLVKVNKAMKSGTLQLTLHSKVARRTKPYVVKSTDLHCILNTNINKCRREKTTKRTKCQILPSAMYSSHHADVSPEGWTGKQCVFLRIQVPTREQSNKRSGTSLKTESETGKRC